MVAKLNSAFHPVGVGKSSTGLKVKAERVHLRRVPGNPVWSHTQVRLCSYKPYLPFTFKRCKIRPRSLLITNKKITYAFLN